MVVKKLTERQIEVLEMIAFEKSILEISNEMYLSHHTVISHKRNLMRRLNVKNTAGLIRRSFELGYLTVGVKVNSF